MSKIRIAVTDIKNIISESFAFANALIYGARAIVLYAFLFVGFLLLLDWLNIVVTSTSLMSKWDIVRMLAEKGVAVNDVLGVRYKDYFADILVMVAGVLGVILGLLFTTTISIIATKYSNISTAISSLVLKQYIMNRYFKLLAIMTVTSILYLFILVTGYTPTFISVSIYTLATVFSVAAFITFGQFAISYFDASRVVSDLISHIVKAMNRLIANNSRITKNEKYFKSIIRQTNSYINKISLIVEASKTHQMSNTSFDEVSESLTGFAMSYSKIKYLIPSVDGWHPKHYVHRRWSEVSCNSEFYNVYKYNGLSLPHSTVADYLTVEKKIIDIQFSILESMQLGKECLIHLQNLGKYLQIIAYQCDIELFVYFFDKCESFVKERLSESKSNAESHQLAGLYVGMQIEYIIGAYSNIKSLITAKRLKSIAGEVYNTANTKLSFPYFIREWYDSYIQTLCNEKAIEGSVKTPMFFTEYVLGSLVNDRLQEYTEKIIEQVVERYKYLNDYLKSINKNSEAVFISYTALNICVKVDVLIEQVEEVLTDVNTLNYKDNKKFTLLSAKKLCDNGEKLRENLLEELWNNGIHAIGIGDLDLQDINGDIYHTLNQDITDIAFNDRRKFALYLSKFSIYAISYMQRVRSEQNSVPPQHVASVLYPLVVDLFEVNSIAIILFRLYGDVALEKSFWLFWDNFFNEQAEASIFLCESSMIVYEYVNKALLATYGSISMQRRRLILDCIIQSGELEKESIIASLYPTTRYKLKRGSDIYIDPIIRDIDGSSFDFNELPEVFIEYYMRTNILLKDRVSKLTRYGRRIKY